MTPDVNEMNQRLLRLATSTTSRFWRVDYETLSRAEQVFLMIWELEAEVNNGGFRQYFSNRSGIHAPNAPDALRRIGATTMAVIVEQAVNCVGHVIWWDDNKREATLTALAPETVAKLDEYDRAFFAYPDNLTALLYKFVCEHRAEMIVPAEF